MGAITLEKAEEMLASYLESEKKILQSQEYRIADRMTQRAMLEDVQRGRAEWERKVNALNNGNGGGPRITYPVPR